MRTDMTIALELEDKASKRIDNLRNKIIKLNTQNAKFSDQINKGISTDKKGNNLSERIKNNNIALKKSRAQLSKLNKGYKDLQSSQKGMVGWLRKGKEEIIGFNGAALSTLFFGLYIQQVFTGALKSIFEGYKKALPEGHKFNEMTNKLSANWEFFKFQLADTLAQSPMFQKMIEFTIGLLNIFNKLPDSVKASIVVFISLGAALGFLLFLTSNIKLGMAGIIDTIGNFKGLNFTSLFKLGPLLLVVAGVTALYKAWDIFSESSEYAKKKTNLLKKSFIDTMNSAIQPIAKAFGNMGFEVKNGTESMVVIGAVIHDVILFGGMLLDTIIALIRTLVNLVQIGVAPVIEAFKTLADVWASISTGDFSGAFDSAKSYVSNYADSVMGDIRDIGDAWSNMYNNIDKKREALVSPAEALRQYREEIGEMEKQNMLMSSVPSSVGNTPVEKTQVIVLQNIDDLASYTAKDQEIREILGLNKINPNLIN